MMDSLCKAFDETLLPFIPEGLHRDLHYWHVIANRVLHSLQPWELIVLTFLSVKILSYVKCCLRILISKLNGILKELIR